MNKLTKVGLTALAASLVSVSAYAGSMSASGGASISYTSKSNVGTAGTGNPFFSTDTAASLRASEMSCSKILKATKVNGIYDSDPNLNKNAKLIRDITYSEVISKNLRVMDLTAISLAKESKIPIYITNIFEENSLIRSLKEEGNYSKIH